MNPIEIEKAVSALALEPFDPAEFPYQFLAAFGNKETALVRLRAGATNQSDIGGVLQRGNIHIATCQPGGVDDTLNVLRKSPKTASQKAKFILATDGEVFQAEDLSGTDTVACNFAEFPDHFGFFLPLAGISYTTELKETELDRRAASRLQRLYVTLLRENPDWASRPQDMNHFMARLIFCFFAEDTDIFFGESLFTKTIEQMSGRDASDTHLVMSEIFRAMDTKTADREAAGIKRYANAFPYVNGQLFSGNTECPTFSKIARSYLLHIGSLNWKKINPDIFGSMIQAVTDDEERGALGMHYTNVPNILKVLNPLFLDDLRASLEEANDNGRKLLNLRNRMAKIRVFDPACGSGNFLVIAYKEMRGIEAEINKRRGEPDRRSDIPLTNFRGIELRDFPAEIARLALIIAEYQCDVLYRGQKEALAEFLPLDSQNWITCGNALWLDWFSICPPTGTSVKVQANDLFETPLDQAEIDFENEGGETYICGNPPFAGQIKKTDDQRADMDYCLGGRIPSYKNLDYVSCWYFKAGEYQSLAGADYAFVSTNSICQGRQVELLWPKLLIDGARIVFCHRPFKWANSAQGNAGVTCIVVGVSRQHNGPSVIYDDSTAYSVDQISPYLTRHSVKAITASSSPMNGLPSMTFGSMPNDGGALLLAREDAETLSSSDPRVRALIRQFLGADELINGTRRYCLWLNQIPSDEYDDLPEIASRIEKVRVVRSQSKRAATKKLANIPHLFGEIRHVDGFGQIAVPAVSSEGRDYLPAFVVDERTIISNRCFSVFTSDLFPLAIVVSSLHRAWIDAVCGKLESRYNYSNTLGWNTFPVPALTDQNKADLTRCAEDILMAREAHFPATVADLYDPDAMPEDLRAAHERNDEVLERIYIGRRFRNDTERLEKLFELYTNMTTKTGRGKAA
jgi:hypothetical protein